jgi:glucan 1,3-beta-glucosidase
LLSADALAKLNQLNQHDIRSAEVTPKKERRQRPREVVDERVVVEKSRKSHKRKKRRVVSGELLEEGEGARVRGLRGGVDRRERLREEDYDRYYEKYEKQEERPTAWSKKKKLCRRSFTHI